MNPDSWTSWVSFAPSRAPPLSRFHTSPLPSSKGSYSRVQQVPPGRPWGPHLRHSPTPALGTSPASSATWGPQGGNYACCFYNSTAGEPPTSWLVFVKRLHHKRIIRLSWTSIVKAKHIYISFPQIFWNERNFQRRSCASASLPPCF